MRSLGRDIVLKRDCRFVVFVALTLSLSISPALSAPTGVASSPTAAASDGEVEEIAPGLFRNWIKLPNDWALLRFSKDRAGKDGVGCEAVKLVAQETGLRITLDKASRALTYGFMTSATGVVSKPVKVRYWFDDDKAGAQTIEAENVKSRDDMDWLSAAQNVGDAVFEKKLRTLKKITFAYPDESKTRTQAFPLAGTNAVLDRLSACVSSI